MGAGSRGQIECPLRVPIKNLAFEWVGWRSLGGFSREGAQFVFYFHRIPLADGLRDCRGARVAERGGGDARLGRREIVSPPPPTWPGTDVRMDANGDEVSSS